MSDPSYRNESRFEAGRVFKGVDGNVGVSLSPYMEAFHIGAKKQNKPTTTQKHCTKISSQTERMTLVAVSGGVSEKVAKIKCDGNDVSVNHSHVEMLIII